MKLAMVRIFVAMLRLLYAPMKLRKTKRRVVWLSRQSNTPSADMTMLSHALAAAQPNVEQVFRLRYLRGEGALPFSYLFTLLGDMWALASAKVAITDTYSVGICCLHHKKKLVTVQIWHALGAVKQFGLQAVGKAQGRDKALSDALCMHQNYNYVLTPSKATGEFYREAFGCQENALHLGNLPRVDVIVKSDSRQDEFLRDNPACHGKKLFCYLPTFRAGDSEIIANLQTAFAHRNDMALVTAPHPLSGLKKSFEGNYSTYDLMKLCDGIITDYSACGIEASLLQKPLWFYLPDYDRYKAEQGLNTDPTLHLPAACCETAEGLISKISAASYDFNALAAFSHRFVEHQQPNNTDRLVGWIIKELL